MPAVTLEFTLNEAPFAEMASPERKYFELLLRRLLASPAAPAVLVLHHYGWWEAAGDGLDRGLFYREPESALSALSHFYDVPTVSVRAAAWRLMQAGLMGFKVRSGALGLWSTCSLPH